MKKIMILVAAAIALLSMVCAAQAATTISVTGTANSEALGYTSGQECTFIWTLNPLGTTSEGSSFQSYSNTWSEESTTHSELYTNLTGTGLTGTYSRPIAYEWSPYSVISVGDIVTGPSWLSCSVGYDSGTLGLNLPDNSDLWYLGFTGTVERQGFSGFTFPLAYVNPASYFAGFSGTYSFAAQANMVLINSDYAELAFTPTSLTISSDSPAVPEPMSIMLGVMGLGSIAGFTKLRRK